MLENPDINKAVQQIEESAFSNAQLLGYDDFWDAVRVEKTLVSDAIRKGMEKGQIEGERRKQIEIAKNMKIKGIDSETICELTRLTIKDIKKIYCSDLFCSYR